MNQQPPRRRISKAQIDALLAFLNELRKLLPPRYRPAAAAFIALLSATIGTIWYQTAPSGGYAATAILADGRDVNMAVRNGRAAIYPIEYDREGHGYVLRATEDRLTRSVGVAPVMGWGLDYMRDVSAGRRGLRYCANELTGFPELRAASVRAVVDTFDSLPGVLPSTEDCSRFDLELGATPESDCGTPLALGCAAHRGSYVRVTVRADIPFEAAYWVMVHEVKHAGDLGHTGVYGGEGRAHGHCSDLGFIDLGVGGTNRPVDNATGKPCLDDWLDGAGGYRHQFRHTATATRTASPTPTPTATPTPTPPPAPVTQAQMWFYRRDGARDCAIGGDGDWLVITCAVGTPPRYWHRWTDGEFVEVGR